MPDNLVEVPADVLQQVYGSLETIAYGQSIDKDTREVIDQEDMEQIAKNLIALLQPYLPAREVE